MKSFLIIGMGSFGHHLCRKLCEQKCEIMIVDEKAEALEDMLPYVVSAKVGDCTNADTLKSFAKYGSGRVADTPAKGSIGLRKDILRR